MTYNIYPTCPKPDSWSLGPPTNSSHYLPRVTNGNPLLPVVRTKNTGDIILDSTFSPTGPHPIDPSANPISTTSTAITLFPPDYVITYSLVFLFLFSPLLVTLHHSKQGDLLKQKVGDYVSPLIEVGPLVAAQLRQAKSKSLPWPTRSYRSPSPPPSCHARPESPFQGCLSLPLKVITTSLPSILPSTLFLIFLHSI